MAADKITAEADNRTRIDKWLWAARFFKTRSLAAQAIEGGKVKLNDERVKAAKSIRIGDRLTIQIGARDWSITVRGIAVVRGPAEAARTLYEEDEASRERRERAAAMRHAGMDLEPAPGGRPEKKQRRALQRLRGY